MIKKIFTIALLVFGFRSLAQVPIPMDKSLLEERKDVLQRIRGESGRFSLTALEKERLSQQHGFPLTLFLDQGKTAEFQFIDEAGTPVYYNTFNINAALTTGASSLQQGGELGLDLSGRGMVAGIYDQTRPKANHREFGGRVTQIDGSTEIISNHATHVTGTILAAGLNANARGMASEAIGWAFNWEGDISKMIQNGYDPDLRPGGHIISNHSYGFTAGWYRHANGDWAWAGNEAINNREDYRFGFYSSLSQQLDELAFSKPYYTVVRAAGNERTDVGDGTKNPDGPEDSITPEGVAKNNITIGAVGEVRDYKGPEDVVMSSFSSWGPVDDGRIKPDLVAMGVNVFSTAISSEGQQDSYTTMSGTSMAAPNAAGSLFLLQELYHSRNSGRYMRAATLKGLAIHTAKEAGASPGPDYRFGWGLLDVKAAAELIINENGGSNMIRELVLDNNQIYEYEFISDGVSPIKATISWTDPAGTPPAPSVNPQNLMLVNDLDIRIIDEDGESYFPWTLDPRQGSIARAVNDRDNYRDNVEQIVINAPQSKKYKVTISHKGTLKNNLQAFSLILNAGMSDGQDKTLYWIGGEGDWNSSNNWSLESNGASAGAIPDRGTRVVFDQAASSLSKVTLSDNAQAFSLNFFGNATIEMDLNSKEIIVNDGLRVSNQITTIKNGKLTFSSDANSGNIIDMGTTVLEEVELSVTAGDWRMVSAGVVDQLRISNAGLELDFSNLQVNGLALESGSSLSGRIQEIAFKESIAIDQDAIVDVLPTFKFVGAEGTFTDSGEHGISSLVNQGGRLQLRQLGLLAHLGLATGETQLMQASTRVNTLDMRQGIVLNLMESNQIEVTGDILHQNASGKASLIKAGIKAVFKHDPYKKYCFTNIEVENVDLSGKAVINLGSNATVTNSANWLTLSCSEVLFTNFETDFNCVGALVEFNNTTEGPATRYEWKFGSSGSSTEKNPSFVFPQKGIYKVTLSAYSAGKSMVYEKEVTIGDNMLQKPSIVTNGSTLTSLVPASQYQWYRNGNKIEGAVDRSFLAEDEGSYQVAVLNESCNRVSDAVVISGMPDQLPLAPYGYFIGPNPTFDVLRIAINNDYLGQVDFEFYGTNGALLQTHRLQKNQTQFSKDLRVDLQPGLYVLLIKTGDLVLHQRIIKL